MTSQQECSAFIPTSKNQQIYFWYFSFI